MTGRKATVVPGRAGPQTKNVKSDFLQYLHDDGFNEHNNRDTLKVRFGAGGIGKRKERKDSQRKIKRIDAVACRIGNLSNGGMPVGAGQKAGKQKGRQHQGRPRQNGGNENAERTRNVDNTRLLYRLRLCASVALFGTSPAASRGSERLRRH